MTTYDVIVIGGGVVGASTAYHLVRAGAKTLLVDRCDAGRATDAGAGIMSTATVDTRTWPIVPAFRGHYMVPWEEAGSWSAPRARPAPGSCRIPPRPA